LKIFLSLPTTPRKAKWTEIFRISPYSLQHHASRKRRTMAVFFSLIPSTDK
jgi:hypothetical protein